MTASSFSLYLLAIAENRKLTADCRWLPTNNKLLSRLELTIIVCVSLNNTRVSKSLSFKMWSVWMGVFFVWRKGKATPNRMIDFSFQTLLLAQTTNYNTNAECRRLE
jgi:hypothetical protein